jgi:hypothetical protein
MIVNITDPNRRITYGDPVYKGDYLLFSFEVEGLISDFIYCNEYNTYIDGELV